MPMFYMSELPRPLLQLCEIISKLLLFGLEFFDLQLAKSHQMSRAFISLNVPQMKAQWKFCRWVRVFICKLSVLDNLWRRCSIDKLPAPWLHVLLDSPNLWAKKSLGGVLSSVFGVQCLKLVMLTLAIPEHIIQRSDPLLQRMLQISHLNTYTKQMQEVGLTVKQLSRRVARKMQQMFFIFPYSTITIYLCTPISF